MPDTPLRAAQGAEFLRLVPPHSRLSPAGIGTQRWGTASHRLSRGVDSSTAPARRTYTPARRWNAL